MVKRDESQTFLFTFRCNGETNGEPLTEVLVEQLADYDPAVSADTYKRSWFGAQDECGPLMMALGFGDLDVQGVLAGLSSHRDVDRRLTITPDQLKDAGFKEVA